MISTPRERASHTPRTQAVVVGRLGGRVTPGAQRQQLLNRRRSLQVRGRLAQIAVPGDGGSAVGFEDTGGMAEAQSSARASDGAPAMMEEVEEQAIREQRAPAVAALHQRLDRRLPSWLSPVSSAKAMRRWVTPSGRSTFQVGGCRYNVSWSSRRHWSVKAAILTRARGARARVSRQAALNGHLGRRACHEATRTGGALAAWGFCRELTIDMEPETSQSRYARRVVGRSRD